MACSDPWGEAGKEVKPALLHGFFHRSLPACRSRVMSLGLMPFVSLRVASGREMVAPDDAG